MSKNTISVTKALGTKCSLTVAQGKFDPIFSSFKFKTIHILQLPYVLV